MLLEDQSKTLRVGNHQTMAQKPTKDARQADFFGAPEPTPIASPPRPVQQTKPSQTTTRSLPPPSRSIQPEQDSLDDLAAHLSPAELSQLVAALPDPALAHLVIATVRQLRRRLARTSRHADTRSVRSPLERAARQLIEELREQGDDDDF
jgi:hypothetical protein